MDFLCILISIQFYRKLNTINNEYIDIIESNELTPSNFAIRINNLKLNNQTQDERMLKMKLWLHFTKILNDPKNSEIKGDK